MPAQSRSRSETRRLLVVTSLYPTIDRPEAGIFVARRVRELRARGVRVVVASSSTYRHGALRRHLEIARKALAARGRFDGVEGHVLFPAGLIALVAAKLRGRPLLVYAHGWDVNGWPSKGPLFRRLASLVARGASAVVTNSKDTASSIARLGADAHVVSPGVDFDEFKPSGRSRDEIRRKLGLPRDLVALYVGALIPRKGADVFAAAIDLVPNWHGVMVGAGELGPQIASRYPCVDLRGPVPPEEVAEWLCAADVVVAPSRQEPLGLAAIEALACGTPIVASRVGGLADVVVDGENGVAVPVGDVQAVARALDQLEDPVLRSRLASKARASVARHEIGAATDAMARVWAELGVEGIG